MITHINIEGFKSIQRADLVLRDSNVFFGQSGSGKTNALEALRLIAGLAGGVPLATALENREELSGAGGWNGLRGGRKNAGRKSADGITRTIRIRVGGKSLVHLKRIDTRVTLDWALSIALSGDGERIIEDCFHCDRTLYNHQGHECGSATTRNAMAGRMGIAQLACGEQPMRYNETGHSHREDDHDSALVVANELAQMQSVELNDAALRRSVRTGGQRLDPDGENLTAVVDDILAHKQLASGYRSWMRAANNEDIDKIETYRDDSGVIRLRGRIGGADHHSESWSSGLLRMAAITALFFQQAKDGLLMIENVDAGTGNAAGRIINELLHTHSLAGQRQVITTTSSSNRLDWIQPKDYASVFAFTRDSDARATEVNNVSQLAARSGLPAPPPGRLGQMLEYNWAENAAYRARSMESARTTAKNRTEGAHQ